MMRWKRSYVWAMIVSLCGLISWQVFAAEPRVFDSANLFTADQVSDMEEQIQTLQEQMGMDVVIVTTDDAGAKSSRDYADDFYEQGGFGDGRQHSGVLFLIDMDNREIYISTEGAMIRFLTDQRIEQMLDREYDAMSNSDYAGAAEVFLEDVKAYFDQGIPGGQYNYDSETGAISVHRTIAWYEALLAFAVAAICGGGACLSVKRGYAMERERQQGASYLLAYRADAKFALAVQQDLLADKSVSRTMIPRSTGGGSGSGGGRSSSGRSTTHRSSSGRSHGGGGRKF